MFFSTMTSYSNVCQWQWVSNTRAHSVDHQPSLSVTMGCSAAGDCYLNVCQYHHAAALVVTELRPALKRNRCPDCHTIQLWEKMPAESIMGDLGLPAPSTQYAIYCGFVPTIPNFVKNNNLLVYLTIFSMLLFCREQSVKNETTTKITYTTQVHCYPLEDDTVMAIAVITLR